MNILEYIDYLIEECGYDEDTAGIMADIEFGLDYEGSDEE